MEILDQIKLKIDGIKKQKEELTAALRKDFAPLFSDLFSKSKIVKSFGWNQYTPYFNDGEECVFGVNADYIYINGRYEEDFNGEDDFFNETHGWGQNKVGNPFYIKEEAEVFQQIKEILKSIPDEFYRNLFGDHVTVTVKSDGTIETEEYDHD